MSGTGSRGRESANRSASPESETAPLSGGVQDYSQSRNQVAAFDADDSRLGTHLRPEPSVNKDASNGSSRERQTEQQSKDINDGVNVPMLVGAGAV